MAASLLDPIKLGAIDAPNRIIMAPLTRGRAGPGSSRPSLRSRVLTMSARWPG